MPELLVTGSAGMLARAVCAELDGRGADYAAPDEQDLDLLHAERIAAHVRPGVRCVINCAAWTDVDGAEAHEAEATRINAAAVEWLARRAAEVDATLVHVSTDYVFCGTASEPYPIDAPRHPLGAYGRSKLAGELALERSGCRYYLVRTSWLYAPWGKNFVLTMKRLLSERESVTVVADQVGRPTSAQWLARAALDLVERGAPGAYHVTDSGQCSWFELSRAIARELGSSCEVRPCTTAEFPRPARRPSYSVLDLSRTEQVLGTIPGWQDNLAAVLRQAG